MRLAVQTLFLVSLFCNVGRLEYVSSPLCWYQSGLLLKARPSGLLTFIITDNFWK